MATTLVYGTALADTLSTDLGTTPNDTVFAYAGNDTIKAGTGTNIYNGGAGIDTVNYGATSPWAGPSLFVWADLSSGFATANYQDGSASSDTLVSIENLTGTNGDDVLIGDANANKLSGGNGVDWLDGQGGVDNLLGANGDDHLVGGTGNDKLNGGNGSDTYYWATGDGVDTFKDTGTGATNVDVINSSAGVFTGLTGVFNSANGIEKIANASYIDGSAAIVTWDFSSIDLDGAAIQVGNFNGNSVIGSVASDVMYGGTLKDTFKGGLGDDTLYGNAGNDTLNGDGGNDLLLGEIGNDVMNGGIGNDVLNGGAGKDTYTGGAGNDTFHIKLGESSTLPGQFDVITQFQGVFTPGGDNDFVVFDVGGAPASLFAASDPLLDTGTIGFTDGATTNFVAITVVGGTIGDFVANMGTDWAFV